MDFYEIFNWTILVIFISGTLVPLFVFMLKVISEWRKNNGKTTSE